MNNNDISLFEKIAFVNNIPDEGDAYQLSKDYPFAVIVTEETPEGIAKGIEKVTVVDQETQEEVDIVNTDVPNPSSGNLWLGGKRLTKFINIDDNRHSIPMDTYTIELGFDQTTGLLSLYTKAKIEDYELITLFYKDIHNKLNIYVNKDKIREEYDSGNVTTLYDLTDEGTLNWVTGVLDANDTDYLDLKYSENSKVSWDIKDIDSADNSVYLIVRYESGSDAGIATVDNITFNMHSTYTDVYDTPILCDFATPTNINKLKNYNIAPPTNGVTVKFNDEDIAKIANATYRIKYKAFEDGGRKPGRYVIYKFKVTKNIINSSTPDYSHINITNSDIQFRYDSLLDFSYGVNVKRKNTFINPSFNPDDIELYCDGELVDKNDPNIFVMPGGSVNMSLRIKPDNVGKLKLYILGQCNNYNSNNYTKDQNEQALKDAIAANTFDDTWKFLGWSDESPTDANAVYYNNGSALVPHFSCPIIPNYLNQHFGASTSTSPKNRQYIIFNDEYESNNQYYSDKFDFTINASENFVYKNGVTSFDRNGNPTWNNPTHSILRLVLVKEEDDIMEDGTVYKRNIPIYDTGNTYNIYKYTYEGLEISNWRWGTNYTNIDLDHVTSGNILEEFTAGSSIKAKFSKRKLQNELITDYKLVTISPEDTDLLIKLELIDKRINNAYPGRNNHEPVDILNIPQNSQIEVVFTKDEYNKNTFPEKIFYGRAYYLYVPCIYKTTTENGDVMNILRLSYSYHDNILNTTTAARDNASIKEVDVHAAQITGLKINQGLTINYDLITKDNEGEHTTRINYITLQDPKYDNSSKDSIPSGQTIHIVPDSNDTNNSKTIKILYRGGQTLDALKYAYQENSIISLTKLKQSISIGEYNEQIDNLIDNQNDPSIKNKNNNPYITENNIEGVLDYESDININGDTLIYLQLKIQDPNDGSIVYSSDMLCMNFSQYIVQWLFYIGINYLQYPSSSIGTVNGKTLLKQGNNYSKLQESDGSTSILIHRAGNNLVSHSYSDATNGGHPDMSIFDRSMYNINDYSYERYEDPLRFRVGFRYLSGGFGGSGDKTVYQGGWSYLGKLLTNPTTNKKYIEYGSSVYAMQGGNIIFNAVSEQLRFFNYKDNQTTTTNSRNTFLVVIPQIFDIIDLQQNSMIPAHVGDSSSDRIRFNDITIDNGLYYVVEYSIQAPAFMYNIVLK